MPHRKSTKTTRKVARSTARSTARAGRGAARRTTETRETRTPRRPSVPTDSGTEHAMIARAHELPPHELYRHEKRRRAGQRGEGPDPLEEARRVFNAMIEAGVGTPRGGRPRKAKPRPGDDEV